MGQGPAPGRRDDRALPRARGSTSFPAPAASRPPCPGAVDAWLLLLRDHGTWELADVLAYAIGYARDGHPLARTGRARRSRRVARAVHRALADLRGAVDAGRRSCPSAGTIVRNPAYAAVLDGLVARVVHASATTDRSAARRASTPRGASGRPGLVAQAAAAFLAAAAPALRRRRSRRRDHAPRTSPRSTPATSPPSPIEFRGHTDREGRRVDAGPRAAADAAHPGAARRRPLDPSHRGRRAHDPRGAQARPRRPRRVLRRRATSTSRRCSRTSTSRRAAR